MSSKKPISTKILRVKTDDELLKELKTLREELQNIRFTRVAGTSVQKISRIRTLRRSIARVLTVIRQRNKDKVVKNLRVRSETQGEGDSKKTVTTTLKYLKKKYLPLDLRVKKTRAIRQRLTKFQAKLLTLPQLKRKLNFPKRTFAVPLK